MKLIDILIFSLSAIGLVYFMFDRIKYSNRNAFHDKSERLEEINKIIANIERDKKEIEEIIKSTNADTVYNNEITDKLINYRDNEDYLKELKEEQRKIELYLRHACKYISADDLGI
jgi:uncharacterized membrane protein YvbJ